MKNAIKKYVATVSVFKEAFLLENGTPVTAENAE